MLERGVVAADDEERVAAERVLRRRGFDEVERSHRERHRVSLAELAGRVTHLRVVVAAVGVGVSTWGYFS